MAPDRYISAYAGLTWASDDEGKNHNINVICVPIDLLIQPEDNDGVSPLPPIDAPQTDRSSQPPNPDRPLPSPRNAVMLQKKSTLPKPILLHHGSKTLAIVRRGRNRGG